MQSDSTTMLGYSDMECAVLGEIWARCDTPVKIYGFMMRRRTRATIGIVSTVVWIVGVIIPVGSVFMIVWIVIGVAISIARVAVWRVSSVIAAVSSVGVWRVSSVVAAVSSVVAAVSSTIAVVSPAIAVVSSSIARVAICIISILLQKVKSLNHFLKFDLLIVHQVLEVLDQSLLQGLGVRLLLMVQAVLDLDGLNLAC